MATKVKSMVHNRVDLVSVETDSAGKLAKDIFDFIEANDDTSIDLTISHAKVDDSRVLTTVTIANT